MKPERITFEIEFIALSELVALIDRRIFYVPRCLDLQLSTLRQELTLIWIAERSDEMVDALQRRGIQIEQHKDRNRLTPADWQTRFKRRPLEVVFRFPGDKSREGRRAENERRASLAHARGWIPPAS